MRRRSHDEEWRFWEETYCLEITHHDAMLEKQNQKYLGGIVCGAGAG